MKSDLKIKIKIKITTLISNQNHIFAWKIRSRSRSLFYVLNSISRELASGGGQYKFVSLHNFFLSKICFLSKIFSFPKFKIFFCPKLFPIRYFFLYTIFYCPKLFPVIRYYNFSIIIPSLYHIVKLFQLNQQFFQNNF